MTPDERAMYYAAEDVRATRYAWESAQREEPRDAEKCAAARIENHIALGAFFRVYEATVQDRDDVFSRIRRVAT